MNDLDQLDVFAGYALQGLLAGLNLPKKSHNESTEQYADRVAAEAYAYAEAMLRWRSQASST